jgi:hypothetical protein
MAAKLGSKDQLRATQAAAAAVLAALALLQLMALAAQVVLQHLQVSRAALFTMQAVAVAVAVQPKV